MANLQQKVSYNTFQTETAGVIQERKSSSLKAKAVVLGFLLVAFGAFVGQKASQAWEEPLELADIAEDGGVTGTVVQTLPQTSTDSPTDFSTDFSYGSGEEIAATTEGTTATEEVAWDPVNCPSNPGHETCWGDSAFQECADDRQGAYDAVMELKPDQEAMYKMRNACGGKSKGPHKVDCETCAAEFMMAGGCNDFLNELLIPKGCDECGEEAKALCGYEGEGEDDEEGEDTMFDHCAIFKTPEELLYCDKELDCVVSRDGSGRRDFQNGSCVACYASCHNEEDPENCEGLHAMLYGSKGCASRCSEHFKHLIVQDMECGDTEEIAATTEGTTATEEVAATTEGTTATEDYADW